MTPAQCEPWPTMSVFHLVGSPPSEKSRPIFRWLSSGWELSAPESMIAILTPSPVRSRPRWSRAITR